MIDQSARGRPAVDSGIKHARQLPSHATLKFRSQPPLPNRSEATPSVIDPHESTHDGTLSIDRAQDVNGSDDDYESDSSEKEMLRQELTLLRSRQAAKVSKAPQLPAKKSAWRKDTPFGRTNRMKSVSKNAKKPKSTVATPIASSNPESRTHRQFLHKFIQ